MTKQEVLKAISDNLGLFDDAEKEVLTDVLEYNTKDKKEGEQQPDTEEKPEKAEEGEKQEGEEHKEEAPAEGQREAPEQGQEQPAPTQEPQPQPQPEAQPQPQGDPRIEALLQQFGQFSSDLANLKEVVSKIVVVKPSEGQTQQSGYGEQAKGNPTGVQNTSAFDGLIKSMGGYGR